MEFSQWSAVEPTANFLCSAGDFMAGQGNCDCNSHHSNSVLWSVCYIQQLNLWTYTIRDFLKGKNSFCLKTMLMAIPRGSNGASTWSSHHLTFVILRQNVVCVVHYIDTCMYFVYNMTSVERHRLASSILRSCVVSKGRCSLQWLTVLLRPLCVSSVICIIVQSSASVTRRESRQRQEENGGQ